mgnify:CR=1 FL=1
MSYKQISYGTLSNDPTLFGFNNIEQMTSEKDKLIQNNLDEINFINKKKIINNNKLIPLFNEIQKQMVIFSTLPFSKTNNDQINKILDIIKTNDDKISELNELNNEHNVKLISLFLENKELTCDYFRKDMVNYFAKTIIPHIHSNSPTHIHSNSPTPIHSNLFYE